MTHWDVEYTDEFGLWWDGLSESDQVAVDSHVRLLEAEGPQLGFPYTSGITHSRHPHMRELRIQARGKPIRVLFAFDPRRCAILLIGGDKTGHERWYDVHIPIADRLYDEHLQALAREGLTRGH